MKYYNYDATIFNQELIKISFVRKFAWMPFQLFLNDISELNFPKHVP